MKKHILIQVLLVSALNVHAESDIRKFSEGEVIIDYSAFKGDGHSESEIKYLMECSDCPGIDGFLPETVLDKISVSNQKYIFVLPEVLISKMYNPHVGKEHIKDAFSVKDAANGVEIKFSGGDGSGSYDVIFDIDFIKLKARRSIFQFPDMEIPTTVEANMGRVSKKP